MTTRPAVLPPAEEALPPRLYAWRVFALVFALMVMNYFDRQIVVSMFPHLKRDWSLSDRELGALVSIVSLLIAVGTLPLAIAADRLGRVGGIIAMAMVWSGATIACAFAGSYATLLFARGFVGLGEAAYGATAAAVVTTLFPERVRSTMLGGFLAAAVVGSVSGIVAGGVIADRWNWQAAFAIAGVVGIALAVVFAVAARGGLENVHAANASDVALAAARTAMRRVLKPRSALLACLGGGLQLVSVSMIYAWLPSYMNRFYGLGAAQAGVRAAWIVLLGAAGAVAVGVIADRMHCRFVRGRLLSAAGAAAATAAALMAAFGAFSPGDVQMALIVIGATTMLGTTGPVATAVVDVAPASLRATALSILTLVQNLVGLAIGPVLAGALSDRLGLQTAMAIVPAASVVAAAVLVIAAIAYEADVRSARAEQECVGDTLDGRCLTR